MADRRFRFFSKSCRYSKYKEPWIGSENDVIELAHRSNQDTPLETYAGINWDEDNECWERELSHDEALEIALTVNFFGDYLVTEI